jgi:hypothetical protein
MVFCVVSICCRDSNILVRSLGAEKVTVDGALLGVVTGMCEFATAVAYER